MNFSYRTAHYTGLGFLLLLIVFMGVAPLFFKKSVMEPFEITSRELSELKDIIEIKDTFEKARENFDKYMKGTVDGSMILDEMDQIIRRQDTLSQTLDTEEKKDINEIINGARRIKTSFLAYRQEVKIDPTGDNVNVLEKIIIVSIQIVSRQISNYISEHNIRDMHETKDLLSETLARGTAALNLIAIAGIISGLLASCFMIRALRRPLISLVRGTRKIQRGDFSFRVEVDTRDEIGELGNAFNKMADELGKRTKALQEEVLERKSKEEALRENEEKLALALEISGSATWEMDYENNEILLGSHFYSILGYQKETTSKSIHDFFNLIHPNDLAELKSGFKRELQLEDHFIEQEFRILSKDGEWKWFSSRARVIERDEKNNPAYIIGMLMDITEKREMEIHLQRAQKMEAIGTLAGGVAHDLNNILSGIVSYPELLLLDLPPDSNMIKPIQTIKKSGEKATAIVQDLLTLARRGVMAQDIVNLNDIISAYLRSPEFGTLKSFYREVEVELDLDMELMNILGSPVHLHKTIMNLISNAVEAMPNGGEIKISTKNTYLDNPVYGYENIEEGDYVSMKIQDSGIGIAHNDLEHIFEPFYTKKIMGKSGTGLGMAVVWGTVRDHKGYIDIQSKPEKGTKVTIYFPVTKKETGKGLLLDQASIYQGNGEKILVVDDVEEQREVASSILKKLGYSVETVPSGEKAIGYCRDKSVDLVILDMIMDPGMDGLETYRKIIEISPGQKAIIASGFSETDKVREAQRLGAGEYIKKPYSVMDIGKAVKTALNKT